MSSGSGPLRPYDYRMWLALGNNYEQISRVEEAINCFVRAHRHGDSEGIAAHKLGTLFRQREMHDDAAKWFQEHIALNDQLGTKGEGYADSLLFIAKHLLQKGEYRQAEEMCQRILPFGDHQQTGAAKAILRDIRSKTVGSAETS